MTPFIEQKIEKPTVKNVYEISDDYGQLHEENCELNDEGGSFDGCTCAMKSLMEEVRRFFESHIREEIYKGLPKEKTTADYNNSHEAIMHSDFDWGYSQCLSEVKKIIKP